MSDRYSSVGTDMWPFHAWSHGVIDDIGKLRVIDEVLDVCAVVADVAAVDVHALGVAELKDMTTEVEATEVGE